MARDHLASALQYGPTEGLAELRERIVEVMGHEGARAGVDDIMVTSGGQQAIDLSIRTFVNPGDTILAEGPTYPGAVPCFTTYEARVEHDPDGRRRPARRPGRGGARRASPPRGARRSCSTRSPTSTTPAA